MGEERDPGRGQMLDLGIKWYFAPPIGTEGKVVFYGAVTLAVENLLQWDVNERMSRLNSIK